MPLKRWFGFPMEVKVIKDKSSVLGEPVDHMSRGGRYCASFPFDDCLLALDWQHPDPSQFVTSFERELSAGLIVSFPCLACHTGHHQAWTLCECQSCGCLWYCASHKRRADCRRCDPLRSSWNNIQIKQLVCGHQYGLPEHQELSSEQWLAIVNTFCSLCSNSSHSDTEESSISITSR